MAAPASLPSSWGTRAEVGEPPAGWLTSGVCPRRRPQPPAGPLPGRPPSWSSLSMPTGGQGRGRGRGEREEREESLDCPDALPIHPAAHPLAHPPTSSCAQPGRAPRRQPVPAGAALQAVCRVDRKRRAHAGGVCSAGRAAQGACLLAWVWAGYQAGLGRRPAHAARSLQLAAAQLPQAPHLPPSIQPRRRCGATWRGTTRLLRWAWAPSFSRTLSWIAAGAATCTQVGAGLVCGTAGGRQLGGCRWAPGVPLVQMHGLLFI